MRLVWQAGASHMIWATFFFVCMKVCVKMLPHLPISELIFFRSAFTFVFCWILLRAQLKSPWGKPAHRHWLLMRGAGGAAALFLYFYLIRHIPLASAYSIQYLAPIFTTIIAFVWLKEKIGTIEWVLFLVAFLGVLMVQGFDTRVSFEHLLIGIAATLCMSFTYVIIRRLRGLESPLTVVFYFSVVTLPIVLLYLPFYWVSPKGWDWGLLLLMVIFTQAAQYYSAKAAFLADKLSKVAIVSYLGIVFAISSGFFFGEYHNTISYIGMGTVVCSVILSFYLKKST